MRASVKCPDAQLAYRLRVLPEQLDRAYARVAALEAEALRYRMPELLRGSNCEAQA